MYTLKFLALVKKNFQEFLPTYRDRSNNKIRTILKLIEKILGFLQRSHVNVMFMKATTFNDTIYLFQVYVNFTKESSFINKQAFIYFSPDLQYDAKKYLEKYIFYFQKTNGFAFTLIFYEIYFIILFLQSYSKTCYKLQSLFLSLFCFLISSKLLRKKIFSFVSELFEM